MKKLFVLPVALMVLFLFAQNLFAGDEEGEVSDNTFDMPLFLDIGPEVRHMRGDVEYKTKYYRSDLLSIQDRRAIYKLDNVFIGLNARFGTFSNAKVGHEGSVFRLTYLQGLDGDGEKFHETVKWPQLGETKETVASDGSLRVGRIFEVAFSHNFWAWEHVAFSLGLGWDAKHYNIMSMNCTQTFYPSLASWECTRGKRSNNIEYDEEVPYISAGMYIVMGENDGVSLDIKGLYSNWASIYFSDVDYMLEADTPAANWDYITNGKDMANVLRGTLRLNVNATERLKFSVGGEYARLNGGGDTKEDLILDNYWWVDRFRLRNWFKSEYYYMMFGVAYSIH